MSFLYVILGFIILISGADLLIKSSSKIAKILRVPTIIIGLSLVAIGTSAPEGTIGIFSGLQKANQVTLGDVIGSSIANILLIIGITTTVLPLKVKKSSIDMEIILSFIVQLIFLIIVLVDGVISLVDGLILLLFFTLYLYYIKVKSKSSVENIATKMIKVKTILNDNNFKISKRKKIKILGEFMTGIASLLVGGHMVVDNSIILAKALGVSDTLIGLTVVSLGTSLPDLTTCMIAAYKKEHDLVLGEIIGSNIFNILFVLGISSVIFPINVANIVVFDIIIMLFTTTLLFLVIFYKQGISKLWGFIFIVIYLGYIIYRLLL